MRSQNFPRKALPNEEQEEMRKKDPPKRIRTEANALFIMRVSLMRDEKLIQLTFEKGKLIEQLMTKDELKETGLSKLSDRELANLNSWLDPDRSELSSSIKLFAVLPAS